MSTRGLLVLAAVAATAFCQISFLDGLNPPAHPFGAPQFPRFSKCMDGEGNGASEEQLDWWQREYGCTTLFASISALTHPTGQPVPHSPHSTTAQPGASSTPDTPKKGGGSSLRLDNGQSATKQGDQVRHRAHRGGGLFAGVGLSSDFYAGGFGRYPGIGDIAQPDAFPWRHAAPNDAMLVDTAQTQHDALGDMASERRRRDAQTCAEFRQMATRVVTWGPLEKVCCNIMCYCDDIQNVTSQDRCGEVESARATRRPKTGKNPPELEQSSKTAPETSPNPHITEQPDLNGASVEAEKTNGFASTSSNIRSFTVPGTSSPPTTNSANSTAISQKHSTQPVHITDSTAVTEQTVTDSIMPPQKKPDPPQGSMASPVMAAERVQRPIWAPMGNADSHYSARTSGHRQEEWGRTGFGDARRGTSSQN